MQVYPKTGTWTCFSRTCSAGSDDQVDFIMKYEKTSNHEMIMKARDLPGYDRYRRVLAVYRLINLFIPVSPLPVSLSI